MGEPAVGPGGAVERGDGLMGGSVVGPGGAVERGMG